MCSFLLCSSSVFGDAYEERQNIKFEMVQEVFKKIEELFYNSSEEEKKNIISKKISRAYLGKIENIDQLNLVELYELDKKSPDIDTTNLLALAVCLGHTSALYEFLKYVDDINDSKYWVWGYRQFYTMAHLTLDPQYPVLSEDISLEARLRIIDLFVQKGINFDIIPTCDYYQNPALAGGTPRGYTISAPFFKEDGNVVYKDIQDQLRVRALLAGANPTLEGTSFSGLSICRRPYMDGKFQYDIPLIVSPEGRHDLYTGWAWPKYLNIMSEQMEKHLVDPFFKVALHPQLEEVIKK